VLSSHRFSSGGTKSLLHIDSDENLHCLASGIKEFIIIPPEYTDVIGPEHKNSSFYHIDVDRFNALLSKICISYRC